MYVDRGILYASAGYYLHNDRMCGLQFDSTLDLKESKIIISDMIIDGKYLRYNSNLFSIKIRSGWKYDDYKRYIIKLRYSNDDQIAIILNKGLSEKDDIRYDRMMQWRDFSARLSAMIMSVLTE